jgi:hypothetical protein
MSIVAVLIQILWIYIFEYAYYLESLEVIEELKKNIFK